MGVTKPLLNSAMKVEQWNFNMYVDHKHISTYKFCNKLCFSLLKITSITTF